MEENDQQGMVMGVPGSIVVVNFPLKKKREMRVVSSRKKKQ
jgi:hypothetical protein